MLKEIFTTKGRMNRLPYLKYSIILMIIMFLTSLEFVPIVNFLLEIYMLFFRGTVGANDYGEDPLN